jgi:NADH-quinone oxidoreductase subunit I
MLLDIAKKMIRVTKSIAEDRIATIDASKEFVHHSDMFRGKHEIDYETCTGCDACNKICPVDAIVMKPLPLKKPNKIPEVNLAICIFCGLCEDVCPTKPEKAIKLSGGDFDMRAGGDHEAQDNFWVKVEVPEDWIEQRKEEERKKAEAAAKKKAEMAAKKKAEAEKKAKEEAEAKKEAEAKEANNG